MTWLVTGNSGTTSTNFLGTTDAQPLSIRTNNAERMRLTTAGELLIGTTASSAGAKLRVAAGGATINNLAIGTDVPGIDYPEQDRTIGVTSTNATLRLQSPNGVALHSGPSGATPEANQRLTITVAGDVGIGTTTPTQKLDVAGTINATSINTGTLDATDIRKGGTSLVSSQWADGAAGISYGAGSVGIGTLNPSYKLNVDGALNATSISAGTLDATDIRKSGSSIVSSQWSSVAGGISYGAGNVGIGTLNPSYKLNVDGAINATDVRTNGASIVSSQWSGTAGTISYGGNVSIGTPPPTPTAAKLSVSGGGATINSISIGTDVAGVPGINYPNEAETIGVATPSATLRLQSPNGLTLHTGAAGATPEANQRLTLSASGDVGIGTTTPGAGYKLDVAGVLNATDLRKNGSSVVSSQWSGVAGGSISYAAGNVGIGTPNPTTNIPGGRAIHVDNPAGGSALRLGNGAVNGQQWEWQSTVINNVGAMNLSKLTSPMTNPLTVLASGNVGIGTTAPQGKLEVAGDIRAGNSDLYFTQPNHNHTGIGNTAGWAAIENAVDYDALMILGRAGTSRGRMVKLWDYLQVNGGMDVTGNLGVGTNSPAARLHVAGGDLRLDANQTFYAPGRMHVHGEEILYLLNKSGVIISRAWGGTGDLHVDGAVRLGAGDAPVYIGGNQTGPFMQLHDDLWFSDPQNGAIWIRNFNDSNWGTMVGFFKAPSSIEYKKDTAALEEPDLAHLLDDALETDVVRFRYKGDEETRSLRLGVIAEDCPEYLLGEDGKSLSPTEYSAMLHGAIKALANRMITLEAGLEPVTGSAHPTVPQDSIAVDTTGIATRRDNKGLSPSNFLTALWDSCSAVLGKWVGRV